MQLTIESKLKQGALYKLVQQHGSQHAVAQLFGVSDGTIGKWITLRCLPSIDSLRRHYGKARMQKIEQALASVGALLEDVFPVETVKLGKYARVKLWHGDIEQGMLCQLSHAKEITALPDFSNAVENRELVERALEILSPRKQKVLVESFGFDGSPRTIREIANDLELTPTRVDRLKHEAMRQVRKYCRKRKLTRDCESV